MCMLVRSRALLVLVALAAVTSTNAAPKASSQMALVEVIRRQLMENNYDYMSSESDENPLGHHRSRPTAPLRSFGALGDVEKISGIPDEADQIDNDGHIVLSGPSYKSIRAQHKAQYVYRAHPDPPQDDLISSNLNDRPKHTTIASPFGASKFGKENHQKQSLLQRPKGIYNIKNSREVHKNDLLYYISDDHFRRSGGDGDRQTSDEQDPTATTVQYKVFTVKTSDGDGRRSGSVNEPQRTFVREQRSGEVVLVRLDDQPFPDFRLPAARRQYMEEEGPAVE